MRIVIPAVLFSLLVSAAASARPVSYPDGWMFMTTNSPAEHSNSLSYSPTARYAVGLSSDYRREDKEWFHTLTYNRLLKRWNTPDSQASLFLQTAAGAASDGDKTNPAAMLGIEGDWETRRLYAAYENRYTRAGGIGRSYSQKARAGVAPYVGGYDDLHTWLMVQLDHQPGERDNVVVTPFVRLFTQEVLGELGVSHKGDVMFNATCQF